jgi:tetratricopeptide (TPR) repeat protein
MNINQQIHVIINLINNREFKKVVFICERLIKKKIINTQIYNFYGLALQNLGNFNKSIKCFNKSIELEPTNFYAFNNLAISLKSIEKLKLAEKAYKNCLSLNPNYFFGIINYASLKEEINQFKESVDLYLKSLKFARDTDKSNIFSKLSKLYLSIGETKKAKEYAFKMLDRNPNDTEALNLLADLIDVKNDREFLFKMETLCKEDKISDNDVINLSFPLGNIHHILKNFEKAYGFYSKGNQLKRKQINYKVIDIITLVKSIKKIFQDPEIYKINKIISDKKIIFICGMPRSGTTLVEQIISSHKDVLPTGENNFLSSFIKFNYLNSFSLDGKRVIKDIFSKENKLQDYVLNLFNEYNFEANVFTDKSVQNYLWIGFIKIFFPNSKIVLTNRNSKDVSLSIFRINFKNGFMNFAYDQSEIATFYNLYFELIDFWKNILNDEIFEIKYENLVENPNFEIKKLIEYCGLDWDENCLNPHKNKSAIKTASINQARKPIYQSSKDTNQYYSKYLKTLYSLLKK